MAEWLSPRKLLDYYVPVSNHEQAERELYMAVITGEIRARLKGIELGPEMRKQIGKLKPEKDDPFGLPPDLELSVEDAKRKWPQ